MESTMPNAIKTLMDQTWSWSREQIDPEMNVYLDDYYDFLGVAMCLTAQNFNEAADLIDKMDTEPREAIVCAIAEDYGADFVEKKLGWLV
jgi:hypothetical protein